jgi:hypothetical protein
MKIIRLIRRFLGFPNPVSYEYKEELLSFIDWRFITSLSFERGRFNLYYSYGNPVKEIEIYHNIGTFYLSDDEISMLIKMGYDRIDKIVFDHYLISAYYIGFLKYHREQKTNSNTSQSGEYKTNGIRRFTYDKNLLETDEKYKKYFKLKETYVLRLDELNNIKKEKGINNNDYKLLTNELNVVSKKIKEMKIKYNWD